MADERDFELLDDYLTNRMSEDDRTAFEQKIQADPDLQHEYALQKRLIEGIKNARVAELKSMLNKAPIPANHTGASLASKIVLGTAIALIAAAGYWYFNQTTTPSEADSITITQEPPKTEDQPLATPDAEIVNEPVQQPPAVQQKPKVEVGKNQTSAGTEHSKPSLARKPDPLTAPAPDKPRRNGENGISVPDVSETGEAQNAGAEGDHTIEAGAAALAVETDPESTLYKFHYQFLDGKVVLFGPFATRSYEVIRLADEGSPVFLYYRDQYYPLEDADNNVRPLEAVTDQALLQKLKKSGNK